MTRRRTAASAPRGRFASPALFRAWLERHHASATELSVHCYKVAHAHKGLTYLQAVDEALCFGWIDGVVARFDDETFLVRFTPRKPKSTWSQVNVRKVKALIEDGRMAPAGLAAFKARTAARTGVYAFERAATQLPADFVAAFQRRKRAWAFFQSQAPWYRRTTAYWVMSAKQEATMRRRLGQLIDCSARRATIPALTKRP